MNLVRALAMSHLYSASAISLVEKASRTVSGIDGPPSFLGSVQDHVGLGDRAPGCQLRENLGLMAFSW